MPDVTVEKVEYAGWPNCYRITNGNVELVATADVGPRIIHCGFVGERNLFHIFEHQAGKSGEPYWMIRGGHRLWIAPEVLPDTYALDNKPVEAGKGNGSLSLKAEVETETRLRKQISIKMSPEGEITVVHQIENTGPKARQFSPWALTVMAPGGTAIAPFPPRASHEQVLLPTNPLTMWAYTDFSDPRWRFTKKYLTLTCDQRATTPQKAGLFHPQTFCAYALDSYLFTKRSASTAGAAYPDFHSSLELFTNQEFLELETLGPLVEVIPDSAIGHVEHWTLQRDVKLSHFDDTELDRILAPLQVTA